MKRILIILAFASFSLLGARAARAQFGGQPGGMPPGGMGPQPMGEEPKEEGPAEEAPEEAERPSDVEPIGGYPGQARRTTQVVEIDGYLRLRTDFFHKLSLGQGYTKTNMAAATPPFPVPLECPEVATPCSSKNLGGGNLRLRLEPTINVSDQVRVLAQIDVFDNTLLGSTPDSLVDLRRPGLGSNKAASGALYNTQDPPQFGTNTFETAVRAKRAWGVVDSEFGSLLFGRMPWQFGRGIAFNNGSCADCEDGTTVDRIMGLTQVYGHQVALSWDFGAQGYHIGLIDLGRLDPFGPPLDLSQRDDVLQLTLALTRIDEERRFVDRAAAGELMVNYGVQLVYRKQGHEVYELKMPDGMAGTTTVTTPTRKEVADSLTPNIDALVFLPSLWFKLAWKALTVDAEFDGVFGKIDNAGPLAAGNSPSDKKLKLRQFGWVVASELRLYKNSFFVGFETGGASGDQAEDPTTYLNYRWKRVPQPPGDHVVADFKYNPDYHIDEILFRRIIGTVTNALYIRPQMTYWLDMAERRQLGFSAALIYSAAFEKVATPGNSLSYGVEMNVGLTYRNPGDGFYAGIVWAVLWPMAALDRPATTSSAGRLLWDNAQDASSAQALRTFFGIRF